MIPLAVTLIAMKCKVVAARRVFTRSECQVEILTTSHCTNIIVCLMQKRRVVVYFLEKSTTHTGECTVAACCT